MERMKLNIQDDLAETFQKESQPEPIKPTKKVKSFAVDVAKPKFSSRDIKQKNNLGSVKDPTIKHGAVSPFARHNVFIYPEYNFSEITSIVETESLVARAFSRKETMFLKQGWSFVGKNSKTVDYIKARLYEIAHISNKPTEQLIREMAVDLIHYSNWFGAVVRDEAKSSGQTTRIGGKMLKPIAGIFTIPAETVVMKFDKKGKVKEIGQEIWGHGAFGVSSGTGGQAVKDYKKHNFFHFKINEKSGYSVGTPILIPVKDDIGALRRIEENFEILLYQYLFPLFQYTVGTETAPAREYPDGSTELDVVRRTWSELPSEGAIVTPERHQINVLGSKNAAMDPMPGVEYFKKRVVAGCEISSIDIGDADTSNRSTSDTLSRILVDSVKFLQRRLEGYFNQYIIRPLLLESTFSDEEILNHENMVYLRFNEIDIDQLIKMQNHYQQLYVGHGITEDELRQKLGEENISEEQRQRMYYKIVEEPKMLMSNKVAGSAESKALGESEFSSLTPEQIAEEERRAEEMGEEQQKQAQANTGESSGSRQIASQNRPSNQHGTKAGPEGRKSAKNLYKSFMISDNIYSFDSELATNMLSKVWDESIVHNKSANKNNDKKIASRIFNINLMSKINSFDSYLIYRVLEGMRSISSESDHVSSIYINDIKEKVESLFKTLLKDFEKKLSRSDNLTDAAQSFSFRVKMIELNESNRAYNLGRALGLKDQGFEKALVKPVNDHSCDKCKMITEIDLNNIYYNIIPPISHPNAQQIIIGIKNDK